jgi:putative membrane protein insertion efficiency factor
LALLTTVPSCGAEAQSIQEDLRVILEHRPERPRSRVQQESAPAPIDVERVAEAETVFAATIRLYQATLSTSDVDACNFWPSCSRFGAASLDRYGLLKGALLAADRLTRCHGLPSMGHHYHLHPATGKYVDPVGRYAFR